MFLLKYVIMKEGKVIYVSILVYQSDLISFFKFTLENYYHVYIYIIFIMYISFFFRLKINCKQTNLRNFVRRPTRNRKYLRAKKR